MVISVTQLSIIMVIVIFLFGTKHFRSFGSDLGGAKKACVRPLIESEKEQRLGYNGSEKLEDTTYFIQEQRKV